jgi:hypothetical protein
MSKVFAHVACLVREIATFLVPVLTAIKLVLEIAGKVANCDGKLPVQISVAR